MSSKEDEEFARKIRLLQSGMHFQSIPDKLQPIKKPTASQDLINRNMAMAYPSNRIKFDGEHHLWAHDEKQRYNYLGPGTQYTRRQELGIQPVNDLDKMAMYHDAGYSLSKDYSTLAKALTRGYHDLGAGAAMITAGLNPWSDAPFAMSIIAGTGLGVQGFLRIHPVTTWGMALVDHLVY